MFSSNQKRDIVIVLCCHRYRDFSLSVLDEVIFMKYDQPVHCKKSRGSHCEVYRKRVTAK